MGTKECVTKSYLRCWEKFVARKQKSAPVLGSATHERCAYSRAAAMEKPPAWYFKRPLQDELEKICAGHPKHINRSEELFRKWKHYWRNRKLKPLGVEDEVRAPLGEVDPECPRELRDEVVTARRDSVEEKPDGRILVLDIKTMAGRHGRLPAWFGGGAKRSSVQVLLGLLLTRLEHPDREVSSFYIDRILTADEPKGKLFGFNRVAILDGFYDALPKLVTRVVAKERKIDQVVARALDAGEDPLAVLPLEGLMSGACHGAFRCDYIEVCGCATIEEKRKMLAEDFVQIEGK